jgi:hypothetical protein
MPIPKSIIANTRIDSRFIPAPPLAFCNFSQLISLYRFQAVSQEKTGGMTPQYIGGLNMNFRPCLHKWDKLQKIICFTIRFLL